MQDTTANIEEDTSFDIFEESDFQTEDTDTTNQERTSEEKPEKKLDEDSKATEAAPDTTVPLKFLGKQYAIPGSEVKGIAQQLGIKEDEVISTIQKGLNYDHAVANTPLHKQIAKLAELNGKTPEEYSAFLDESIGKIGLRHEIEKVKAQYPELEDEAIEIIAQKNLENGELANYKAAKEHEESQKQDREKELAPFKAFHDKYPEIQQFPEEVAAMIAAGTDPTFAYELYTKKQKQINDLTTENNELKQKQTNYYSSMGSSKASYGGDNDDFLSGFFDD